MTSGPLEKLRSSAASARDIACAAEELLRQQVTYGNQEDVVQQLLQWLEADVRPLSVPVMEELSRSKDPRVAQVVVRCLPRVRESDPRVIDILQTLSKHEEPAVRKDVAEALGHLLEQNPKRCFGLIRKLSADTWFVQSGVVVGLGFHGDVDPEETARILGKLRTNPSPFVRRAVAEFYRSDAGRRLPTRAVGDLMALAGDGDESVARECFRSARELFETDGDAFFRVVERLRSPVVVRELCEFLTSPSAPPLDGKRLALLAETFLGLGDAGVTVPVLGLLLRAGIAVEGPRVRGLVSAELRKGDPRTFPLAVSNILRRAPEGSSALALAALSEIVERPALQRQHELILGRVDWAELASVHPGEALELLLRLAARWTRTRPELADPVANVLGAEDFPWDSATSEPAWSALLAFLAQGAGADPLVRERVCRGLARVQRWSASQGMRVLTLMAMAAPAWPAASAFDALAALAAQEAAATLEACTSLMEIGNDEVSARAAALALALDTPSTGPAVLERVRRSDPLWARSLVSALEGAPLEPRLAAAKILLGAGRYVALVLLLPEGESATALLKCCFHEGLLDRPPTRETVVPQLGEQFLEPYLVDDLLAIEGNAYQRILSRLTQAGLLRRTDDPVEDRTILPPRPEGAD